MFVKNKRKVLSGCVVLSGLFIVGCTAVYDAKVSGIEYDENNIATLQGRFSYVYPGTETGFVTEIYQVNGQMARPLRMGITGFEQVEGLQLPSHKPLKITFKCQTITRNKVTHEQTQIRRANLEPNTCYSFNGEMITKIYNDSIITDTITGQSKYVKDRNPFIVFDSEKACRTIEINEVPCSRLQDIVKL